MTQPWKWFVLLGLLFALLGCSGDPKAETADPADPSDTEDVTVPEPAVPVTLQIGTPPFFSDAEYEKYLTGPLAELYPHLTLEQIKLTAGDINGLSELLAGGVRPDILLLSTGQQGSMRSAEFDYDMELLIQQHAFNKASIAGPVLEGARITGGGKLALMPFRRGYSAMYYNKEIFDRFAVSYPGDGMTWQEVRDLAVRVTRLDEGVQYRGFEPGVIFFAAGSQGLAIIDAQTNRAAVNNDGWANLFRIFKSIYDIPGNHEIVEGNGSLQQFFAEQRLAMMLDGTLLQFNDAAMDWDLTTYPGTGEAVLTGRAFDGHGLAITRTSEKKDAAFLVVAATLSEGVQTMLARDGFYPVVTDPGILDQFGANLTYLEGKNIEAIHKVSAAPPLPTTEWDRQGQAVIRNLMKIEILQQSMDINSALRLAEERINAQITGN